MIEENSNCLHCVLSKQAERFLQQHPGMGAQEMVIDVISVLTELVCSAVVNTTDDELTQDVILARMRNIVHNVLPSQIEHALPAFRVAANNRRRQLI